MNKVSLNKIKFSKLDLLEEKNNELIIKLNKIIEGIDQCFKNITVQEINHIEYSHTFNETIYFPDNKPVQEFKSDLEKNGYNVVFKTYSIFEGFSGVEKFKTKLTVNLKNK
jgi:hypothetical protein